MTLFDSGPIHKHCLVYCGDDRCNCQKAPRYRDTLLLGGDAEPFPSVVAPPSGSCGEGEGRNQGASPSGSGSQASPGTPTGCRPEGCDPSRIVAFAKEVIAAGWNAHVDEEFVHRASLRHGLVKETTYDPASHGSNDVDAEVGDPWFVFTGPLTAPGIDTEGQNPKGSGAKHESPVDEVEAPASLVQSSPTPPGDLIQVAREAEKLVGVINEYAEAIRMHERSRLRISVEGVEAADWWDARWKHCAETIKASLVALHRQEKVEDRPEGRVLVPREPTPEMIAAFWRIKNTGSLDVEATGEDRSDYAAYRAMLSASPRPSQKEQDDA